MGSFDDAKIAMAAFSGHDIQSLEETQYLEQADMLKARFDAAAKEVITPAHNAFIDAIKSEGAAAQIGAQEIIPGGVRNVGGQLAYLKEQIAGAVMGQIPDGSITEEKMAGEFLSAMFDMMHPVGSIHITTDDRNPGDYLGGTWTAWGAGRVPVGVDTAQTEFETVEKQGGEKSAELPQHSHTFTGERITTEASAATHKHAISAFNTGNNSASHTHSVNIPYKLGTETGTTVSGESLAGGKGTPGAKAEYNAIPSATTGNNSVSHTHTVAAHNTNDASATHNHTFTAAGTIENAGDIDASNLQPYITCYMWKRTA